jgi:hypothetical protein
MQTATQAGSSSHAGIKNKAEKGRQVGQIRHASKGRKAGQEKAGRAGQ